MNTEKFREKKEEEDLYFDPDSEGIEELQRMFKILKGDEFDRQDLAGFLNEYMNSDSRKVLASMYDSYSIPFSMGKIKITTKNTFDRWKEQSGWEPPD